MQEKVKFTLEQATKAQKGNITLLSLTTTGLDEVGGQRLAPAALPPGKTRYPLYKRLGGPHGRSERVRKISPSTGIRSPDRLARSESLHRLNYSGEIIGQKEINISKILNLKIAWIHSVVSY
jgi:hypothetical protein